MPVDVAQRQAWMRVLALAPAPALAQAYESWEPRPEVQAIRGPEGGLVMVGGRIDAAGDRFNLGEATVARATVKVSGKGFDGEALGTAYALGTDLDRVHQAAVIDAMLVEGTHRDRLLEDVIGPLEAARAELDAQAARRAAATQVDFFTVSREHE